MPINQKQGDAQMAELSDLFDDAYDAYQSKRKDRDYENASFYRGWQYSLDPAYSTQTQADGDEAMEIQNVVRPLVRAAVAATLRQIPNPQMAAVHGDQRSRAKAEAVERFCSSAIHNGVLDWDELHRCVSWSKQTGLGWLKVFWDPDGGREIVDEVSEDEFSKETEDEFFGSENDEKVRDYFGTVIDNSVYEGEIATMFVSTNDCLPNPNARNAHEITHMFHVRLLPVYDLLDMFDVDMFDKPLSAGSFDTGDQKDIKDPYRIEDEFTSQPTPASTNRELAQLVEFWEKPSNRYKNGRFALFSGHTLLYVGPNPLKPRRIPFIPFFGDNLVSGSLYPDGMIEDLKSPQRSLNRCSSKIREHVEKVMNAHIMVPIGSGIDANTWGQKPGQIIRYQKGYKPDVLTTPEIPGSFFNYVDQLADRTDLISGYHDITRGAITKGDISGRAMAFARENEQLSREPEMLSFRQSFVGVLQHCVHLMRQYYDDGRMLRLLGKDGRWEWKEFKEGDFDFKNDIVPEVYSGMPSSPALQFSETLEMMDAGLLSDTPEAERARSMLGHSYSRRSTFHPHQEDMDRANREQLLAVQGEVDDIYVAPYDNHVVHLNCHNMFRKTLEYEELPDETRRGFDQHCEWHENEDQAQLAELGEQEDLTSPTPPPQPMMEAMPPEIPAMGALPDPMAMEPAPQIASTYGNNGSLYPGQQSPLDNFALGLGNTAPEEQM